MKIREAVRRIVKGFFPSKKEVKPEEKLIPEKVAILIDGENLWYSLMALGSQEISDFQEFKRRLAGGKELIKPPIYYRSVDMEDAQQTLKVLGFLAHLESQGYEVKYKPLLKGKEPKSEIDPVIAVDICRAAIRDDIEVIVLVSGDRHFVPAIELAKERGKKIVVVSTSGSLSEELKKASDQWKDLKTVANGLLRKSEIIKKREEALEKLKEGKKIILSSLEEGR